MFSKFAIVGYFFISFFNFNFFYNFSTRGQSLKYEKTLINHKIGNGYTFLTKKGAVLRINHCKRGRRGSLLYFLASPSHHPLLPSEYLTTVSRFQQLADCQMELKESRRREVRWQQMALNAAANQDILIDRQKVCNIWRSTGLHVLCNKSWLESHCVNSWYTLADYNCTAHGSFQALVFLNIFFYHLWFFLKYSVHASFPYIPPCGFTKLCVWSLSSCIGCRNNHEKRIG